MKKPPMDMGGQEVDANAGEGVLRLDKWLWQARFCKSRAVAARLCRDKGVRIDGVLKTRASCAVRSGQTLTFIAAGRVRVIRILALGHRRGPASEARSLYIDLSPPAPSAPASPTRSRGAGRPTKAERRAVERLKDVF
ncbi:MAG: RNA-binding S4 domain-containing protein [Pseudomonadota bacterium]|jgi:ribosome-associated heat shock protein Hsp15